MLFVFMNTFFIYNVYESISMSYFFIMLFIPLLLLLSFITLPLSFGCDEKISLFTRQIKEILTLILWLKPTYFWTAVTEKYIVFICFAV